MAINQDLLQLMIGQDFRCIHLTAQKWPFLFKSQDPIQGPVGGLYIANSDYSEHILIDEGIIYDFTWKRDSQGLIYSKNNDLWEYSIS